jgi:YD repeat-containing protein
MNDALITFVYVSDLDRSAAFYGEVLGLELVTVQPTCRIFRVTDGGHLGICAGGRPVSPDGFILTLVRDDVEAFCEDVVRRGVGLEQEPAHHDEFGITHAFLRDPDGHLVEIQRFDDPDWAEPISRR